MKDDFWFWIFDLTRKTVWTGIWAKEDCFHFTFSNQRQCWM